MRSCSSIWLLIVFFLSLTGCQKELSFETPSPDGNNPASLLGEWKFLNLTATVESGSTFDINGVPGRVHVSYNATSFNNQGLLNVTPNTMETKDFGYSLSAKIKAVTLIGGIPVGDPTYEQFDFDQPPGSAVAEYQLVGSDSIYFPGGTVLEVPGTNGQPMPGASDPSGARYAFKGDTLILKSEVSRTQIIRQDNDEIEMKQYVNLVLNFLRQ